jgi:redox-sensing transcriptional repressor
MCAVWYLVNKFTSPVLSVKRIAESTVRRLSLYLRFLEAAETGGSATISSAELARQGGTTSAQVRKDLSFFGSFGKRGLGYSVPELSNRLRAILGIGQEWRTVIVGAGKIGSALAQYKGLAMRGFTLVAVYDNDPRKIGTHWDGIEIRDVRMLATDAIATTTDIAIVATPADVAQEVVTRLVDTGVKAILNFAAAQLVVPPDVVVRDVDLALELEALSFALTSRRTD